MWNRHRGSEKHEIGSGTKLLFTFLSLSFFDMRRERHNFFLCWLFHLSPPRAAPPLQTIGLASVSFENRLSCSEFKSQLTAFFQIFKSSALPGLTSFTSPVSFLSGFFVTSVIVTSAPHSVCSPNPPVH